MSESLSKAPSRFMAFLNCVNLSILLLLLFWIWQYWQGGGNLASASVDEFIDRQAHFLKITDGYLFEPYIFDFAFIFIPAFIIFLGWTIAEQTKRFAIADTLLTIHSVVVLAACIFIQLKAGALHLWVSTGIAAGSQNALSGYFINRGKAGDQDFDIASSRISWAIALLTLILEICSIVIYFAN